MESTNIKQIHYYIDELQRYCHREGCEFFTVCPQICECKKELDLDTSLAWRVAKYVMDSIMNLKEANDFVLSCVFIINYHKEKYPRLYKLLEDLYICVRLNDEIIKSAKDKFLCGITT